MSKIIFITGASRGFGKLWAEALLQQGHKLVVTARKLNTLDRLVNQYGNNVLPLELDVNNREAGFAAIAKAKEHFGRIDVLINNAGYGLFGTVEETTEEQARAQMETNFFGLLWLTQAVLPIMREQRSGHIIQVSSVLGLVTVPVLGLYNASKFAIEGLSETLAEEVKRFGINLTLVEPNQFATDWAGASATQTETMPEYDGVRADFFARLTDESIGLPEATTPAILKLIESTDPPFRLLLGNFGLPWVSQVYKNRDKEWNDWKEVSFAAQGK